MPIFNIDDESVDDATTPVTETTPEPVVPAHTYRKQDELKTSVLFNKETPLETIADNISGMSWEVNYFLQVLGINESPKMPDINSSQTVIKYNRISKLVITLQTAIDQTDPDEINGEAIINAGIVPNYGDPFIATLTGGREAIFYIDTVVKNNYNLHNTYKVTFKLLSFLDTNVEFYNDLVFKTLTEYVYDKKHLQDFSAPILIKEEYQEKVDLRKKPIEILDYYMEYMVNKEVNVIAAPTENSIYIDTLLNTFLSKIINYSDSLLYSKLNKINIDTVCKNSIWDVLLKRDINLLKRVDKKVGFKFTPHTVSNPEVRHASYLGINFITDKIDTKLDITYSKNEFTDTHEVPVVFDDNYVLSNSFYTQDIVNCTEFEKLVLQYLRGEVIDTDKLDKFLREYILWDREQQFYLLPILILLAKITVTNTFTTL